MTQTWVFQGRTLLAGNPPGPVKPPEKQKVRRLETRTDHNPVTEDRRVGHDHLVFASLFKHKPEQCPFGHSLAPGRPQIVGWKPYICAPAREAAVEGRAWVIS